MLCVTRFLGHYKTMSLERGIGYTYHVPAPCKEEVKVVYADDDIVLVDKPAGLLSVPGRILKDSVFQRLLYEFPDFPDENVKWGKYQMGHEVQSYISKSRP